jgi:hypothetical protein
MNLTKNQGWTQVLWKGKQFLLHYDARRVYLVTNLVINHEWGKDREGFTTNGTYPWSFVTQIFHNGQLSHGGDRKSFEVMTCVSLSVIGHLNLLPMIQPYTIHKKIQQTANTH